MDTSDRIASFRESKALLHGAPVNFADISPNALLGAVEEVYSHPLTLQVTKLFSQIGDLMSDDRYLPRGTKRGVTSFEKGLGVKTFVKACEVSSQNWGEPVISEEDAPPAHGVNKHLLLLKPNEPFKSVHWALWTITCQRVPVPQSKQGKQTSLRWKRILISSEVQHMPRGAVVAWFKHRPPVAYRFLDISIDVQLFSEEKMKLAYALARRAGFLRTVTDRIRMD